MKKDLFEELKEQCRCDYISDLRTKHVRDRAKSAMQTINLKQYSLKELSDVAEYLYDKSLEFSDYAMARRFFHQERILPEVHSEDYCACCGEVIPEGRHICPICAKHRALKSDRNNA